MAGVEARPVRLDEGNRFTHAAVRAIAAGDELPLPPTDPAWRLRADEHGVLTIIAAHLPDTDTDTDDAALRAVRRARAATHLRTVADLRLVKQLFDAAGVPWLAFKGPVLSEIVYQRRGTRDYGDLDVLVRPRDVAGAVARLESAGARTVDGGWLAMQGIGDGESAYELPNGTHVDLHWDVINDRRIRPAFSIDPEQLFGASREVRIDGLVVRTFGVVDTAVHVALHGCHSGGDRLRWLLDLHQSLLRCEPGLPEVYQRAVSLRLGLVLRCMLGRLERFVEDRQWSRQLPAPSAAERAWLALDGAIMTRYPPGSRQQGRFSGAIITDSTRATTLASAKVLVRAVPSTLRQRRRGSADEGSASDPVTVNR